MTLTVGVVCFPSVGGSGVVACELALGLAARGHRAHLISSAEPSRPLPRSDRLTFHHVTGASYALFDKPPYTVALGSALVELSRRHRFDVVHVHYAVPHAASAYLARQVLGKAAPGIVTTLHGTDVTRLGADPSYASVTRFCVAASDGVSAPSAYLAEEARRVFELTREVVVTPNFVDTEHFSPAKTRDPRKLDELFDGGSGAGPTLIHVSNCRPVKRLVDLMEVLSRVRRHVPARLVVVGDGPEKPVAAQRARELGVERFVAFLGKRNEFIEVLRHADVFVLPSESESFGVAALEALSTGIPVVGYAVGGLPEVVTSDVGALVPPLDVDALARAVLELVTEPARRDRLAHAARARAVDRFRPEPALARWEAFYHHVLEHR